MSQSAIQVSNLQHIYMPGTPEAFQALYDASLTVAQGSITALAGESGAGKSTLALYLCGLLRPTKVGQVRIFDRDMAQSSPGRDVGLVFQYPQQQLFERYVGDDIAYGPRKMGLADTTLTERVGWAMEMVGLNFEAFVDRETFSLSGGEMRRAALAGVLAMQPRILVLDEATTGLDPAGQALIHRVMRELRDNLGTTVLLISNDMDEIAELADAVVLLHQGRTIAEGAPREVLAEETRLNDCSLVRPTPMRILAEAGRAGFTVSQSALSLDEAEEELWQALHR